MGNPQTTMPVMFPSPVLKGATQSTIVVARLATKRCDDPDRCARFVVEMAIQLKSSPTSSLPSRVTLMRAIATGTTLSSGKNKRPSSAMHQVIFSASLGRGS